MSGTVEEIAPEDDRVDPENLPADYTPAFVHVHGQGPVFVANYTTLSSGWVAVREWTGDRAKLPPHRVKALREVRTERFGERAEFGTRPRRVADEKKRQQALRRYPDAVEGAEMREEPAGGDERVRTDGGDWYACDCGAEYRNPDAAENCCSSGET